MGDLFAQLVKAAATVIALRVQAAEEEMEICRLLVAMRDTGDDRFNAALRAAADAGLQRTALAGSLDIQLSTLHRRLADPTMGPPHQWLPRGSIPPAVAARMRELQPVATKLRNHHAGHPYRVAREELTEIMAALRQRRVNRYELAEALGLSVSAVLSRWRNERVLSEAEADAILARYEARRR